MSASLYSSINSFSQEEVIRLVHRKGKPVQFEGGIVPSCLPAIFCGAQIVPCTWQKPSIPGASSCIPKGGPAAELLQRDSLAPRSRPVTVQPSGGRREGREWKLHSPFGERISRPTFCVCPDFLLRSSRCEEAVPGWSTALMASSSRGQLRRPCRPGRRAP